MSQILEVMVNGTPLDLLKGEEERFYVTKQVHDLINLETRQAEFTKTIQVPLTNNNRVLIGEQLPDRVRHSNNPSEFLPCEVLITGIPLIQQAVLLVSSQDVDQGTVTCTVFGGSMQFFTQLRDDPISALGWHEYDMEWTLANLDLIAPNTSGITYTMNNWSSNKSYRYAQSQGMTVQIEGDYTITNPELDVSGVWLYTHTVLAKIFGQLSGLNIDLSPLSTNVREWTAIGSNGQGSINLVGGNSSGFVVGSQVYFQFLGEQYASQITSVLFIGGGDEMVLDIAFTVNVNDLNIISTMDVDDYYNKSCIAVPNYNPWLISQNAEGTYSQVSQSVDVAFPEYVDTRPLPFNNVVVDPDVLWDPINFEWVVQVAGEYVLTFQAVVEVFSYDPATPEYTQSFFQMNKNGTSSLGVVNLSDGAGAFSWQVNTREIVTTARLEVGDTVEMRLQTGEAQGGNVDKVRVVTASGGGYNFSINIAGEESGTFLDLGAILPDISQKDFVKQIFNMFDIVPITRNGIVELHYFDEIRDNRKLEENVAINKPRSINSTLIGYAQTNNVKYADNELIERLDANSSFPMSANDAPLSAIKIELLFSASDDMQQTSFGVTTPVSVPAWDLNYKFVADNKVTVAAGSPLYTTTDRNDIKVGDYLGIDTAGTLNRRKVIEILDDFRGNVDVAFPLQQNGLDFHHWWYTSNEAQIHAAYIAPSGTNYNVYDGGNLLLFDVIQAAIFAGISDGAAATADLRWPALLANRYQVIQASVARPFTVTAWFRIGTLKFHTIDGLESLYVPEYEAYFYVNKWEQWKYNSLVRLELIQINI